MSTGRVRSRYPATGAILLTVMIAALAGGASLYQRPKTVLHLVTIKWTADAAPEQRKAALAGIEKAAAAATGVRNLWLRTVRVQPRDFMTAFAIEFEDTASAERFSTVPAFEQWRKTYLPLIDEIRTQEVSN